MRRVSAARRKPKSAAAHCRSLEQVLVRFFACKLTCFRRNAMQSRYLHSLRGYSRGRHCVDTEVSASPQVAQRRSSLLLSEPAAPTQLHGWPIPNKCQHAGLQSQRLHTSTT